MRRRPRQDDDAPGQDSFLDVVANLVGILIILVMIVGARAKDAMLRSDPEPPSPVEQTEVEQSHRAVVAAEQEVRDMVSRMKQQQIEIAYRRHERDEILLRIALGEQALADHVSQLDEASQQAHKLAAELAMAEQRLRDLKMSQEAVEHAEPPVAVLKHRPTPLAKTVFGKEIHFRLLAGRVAVVPIDELVERYKTEAPSKAWKLRDSPRITETVGPVRGFRMKYVLKKSEYRTRTNAGPVVQQRVELDHFVLVPVRDDLGEPLDVALAPQSQLQSILSSYDPNSVTVTVWVYPDSYAEFRELKETLFKQGFLTAGRPLPMNQPISGSPNGTRSTVE